jgi:hypothetical protein
MEVLQSLALKQAFINERNKIDKNKLKEYGPGFQFLKATFLFSKYYKEDEHSRILRRCFGDMELCECGMIFETEDRNHYKNYRPNHHFQSEHHVEYMKKHQYCSDCGTMELKDQHPCFNPMCKCGERYNILHDYYSGPIFYENHKRNSARHHYYKYGSNY